MGGERRRMISSSSPLSSGKKRFGKKSFAEKISGGEIATKPEGSAGNDSSFCSSMRSFSKVWFCRIIHTLPKTSPVGQRLNERTDGWTVIVIYTRERGRASVFLAATSIFLPEGKLLKTLEAFSEF